MDDPLLTAARRLGIATHLSAGPGHGPAGRRIWACWPRSRMEIAHETLKQTIERDRTAGVAPAAGGSSQWRAYSAGWSFEGEFIEAVASLALHVSAAPASSNGPRRTASHSRSR